MEERCKHVSSETRERVALSFQIVDRIHEIKVKRHLIVSLMSLVAFTLMSCSKNDDNGLLLLDPQRTYAVAISSYYKDGGFYNLLKECPVVRSTTLMVRDVVIDYVRNTLGGTLGETYRHPQGRITITD